MNLKILCIIILIIYRVYSEWTWMSGSNLGMQGASYGPKGIPSSFSIPEYKYYASNWVDSKDNFWIFGGISDNDLWKYDGTLWTWFTSSNDSNSPPIRRFPSTWIDSDDNLWLYGGENLNLTSTLYYADLWRFDGKWKWIAGSNGTSDLPIYGSQGISDSLNSPGGRCGATNWIDMDGNLCLFGGRGVNYKYFNDIWCFDGENWKWISGFNNESGVGGIYGNKGISSDLNFPSARSLSLQWIDSKNNVWIYGGTGYDSTGLPKTYLYDLLKYDGFNWTWIAGSKVGNQPDNAYGTKGIPSPTNYPPYKARGCSWVDTNDHLYLFGGIFQDHIWKFDGSDWTWMDGSNTSYEPVHYGTKGIYNPSNTPGGRSYPSCFRDSKFNFWIFGGSISYDANSFNISRGNDLWRYRVTTQLMTTQLITTQSLIHGDIPVITKPKSLMKMLMDLILRTWDYVSKWIDSFKM